MNFSEVDFEIKTHHIESRKKIRILWGNFLTHITEKGLASRVHKDVLLIDVNRGEVGRKIDREAFSSKMEDIREAKKHYLGCQSCSITIATMAIKGNLVRGCHSGQLENH